MQRSRRLSIALAFMAAVFLAVTTHAVVTLLSLDDPVLAAVAVLAGLVCLAATALTWWIARDLQADEEEAVVEAAPAQAVARSPGQPQALSPRPLALRPVTSVELPPAYLDAVMKGAKANRDLYKARTTQY